MTSVWLDRFCSLLTENPYLSHPRLTRRAGVDVEWVYRPGKTAWEREKAREAREREKASAAGTANQESALAGASTVGAAA